MNGDDGHPVAGVRAGGPHSPVRPSSRLVPIPLHIKSGLGFRGVAEGGRSTLERRTALC